MAEQTTIVEYGPGVSGEEAPSFVVQLDDDANGGETTFEPGDDCYVRVLHRGWTNYQAGSSAGRLNRTKANYQYPINGEELIFAMEDEKTLQYLPYSQVTWYWLGDSPGVSVTFDGDKVKLSSPAVGKLVCSYTTLGDQWKLDRVTFDGDVVVVARPLPDGDGAYVDTEWESAEEEEGEKLYDMKVIDYCTGDPVPGVAVTIDSTSYGLTDDNGIVYIGKLTPGSHPLVMTKDGYIASASDKLNNDSIEVEGT
jgi:hypothetical protein